MKTYTQYALPILFTFCPCLSALAQYDGATITMRLNELLINVAQSQQITVQAEIVLPMPVVSVTSAELSDESLLLKTLQKQLPNYLVQLQGGTFFLADRVFMRSPQNPMNVSLKWFRMPLTLDDLTHTLPNRAKTLMIGDQRAGGLTSGLGSVDPGPALKPEVLTNITVRKVISHAATEVHPFVSILAVPASYRNNKTLQDEIWLRWDVEGGDRLKNYRSHCCYGEITSPNNHIGASEIKRNLR